MTSVLRISDAVAIGLHAMTLLAREPGRIVTAHEIAERLIVSEAHLAKVIQRLTRAGLVRSFRGPRGGSAIARAPHLVTLREVVEAVEGPLAETTCLLEHPTCLENTCIMGDVLERMNREVREYFTQTTLADVTGVYGREHETA